MANSISDESGIAIKEDLLALTNIQVLPEEIRPFSQMADSLQH
jgi:hypothetical protein